MLHRALNYTLSLNKNLIIPKLTTNWRVLKYQPINIISQNDIDFFAKLNLEIREIQLFSSIGVNTFPIHVDGHSNTNIGAINYVISSSNDWLMEWFQRNSESELAKLVSPGNTAYMPINESDCILIDQCSYSVPFLVRVDVPHRIVNNSPMDRHCLSIRFKSTNFERLNSILP